MCSRSLISCACHCPSQSSRHHPALRHRRPPTHTRRGAPSPHIMSGLSDLFLPPHLPYPIKITAIAVPDSAEVQRGTRLLSYSFSYTGADRTELRFGTWDSSVEGTVAKWHFKLGDSISQRRAKESPAITVTEPCKHGMQLGGLCCLCGKDMTR